MSRYSSACVSSICIRCEMYGMPGKTSTVDSPLSDVRVTPCASKEGKQMSRPASDGRWRIQILTLCAHMKVISSSLLGAAACLTSYAGGGGWNRQKRVCAAGCFPQRIFSRIIHFSYLWYTCFVARRGWERRSLLEHWLRTDCPRGRADTSR